MRVIHFDASRCRGARDRFATVLAMLLRRSGRPFTSAFGFLLLLLVVLATSSVATPAHAETPTTVSLLVVPPIEPPSLTSILLREPPVALLPLSLGGASVFATFLRLLAKRKVAEGPPDDGVPEPSTSLGVQSAAMSAGGGLLAALGLGGCATLTLANHGHHTMLSTAPIFLPGGGALSFVARW
jgi:hypothetical protein